MSKKIVNVSIALLFHKNKVLVGWRDATQHQGNKAEFPGGKVEENESPIVACRREVFEEVGVELSNLHYFDLISHEYEDLIVNLNIFQAAIKHEQLHAIQSPWQWYDRDELTALNFPKANNMIIHRLQWMKKIKIIESTDSIPDFDSETALYFRTEYPHQLASWLEIHGQQFNAPIIVNVQVWQALSKDFRKYVDAVQFKHNQLSVIDDDCSFQTEWRGIKRIASCHDIESLNKAVELGFDAVFLSPVLETESHPDQVALGWSTFSELSRNIHIPVFALGGMSVELMSEAIQNSAYGLAGMRNI
jgi:8-oxo-dGTP diphosphatase